MGYSLGSEAWWSRSFQFFWFLYNVPAIQWNEFKWSSFKIGLDRAECWQVIQVWRMASRYPLRVLSRTLKGLGGDGGPWLCISRLCRRKWTHNCPVLGSWKFFSLLLELWGDNTATSVCSPSNFHGWFFLAHLAGTETVFKFPSSKTWNKRLRVENNPPNVIEKKGF